MDQNGIITERRVFVEASALQGGEAASGRGLTGGVGMVVGMVPDAGVAVPYDSDAAHRGVDPLMTKHEVNFGDGGGWVDVTAEERTYDYYLGDGLDPAHCAKHTYTNPGTYTIDARVTYWDGAVLYASQFGESVTVTITAGT